MYEEDTRAILTRLDKIIELLGGRVDNESYEPDNASNLLLAEEVYGMSDRETYSLYMELYEQLKIETLPLSKRTLNRIITRETGYKLKNTTRKGVQMRIWS